MKILVTGGLGFVGHALVQKLLSQGHEVHALGRTLNPPSTKLVHGLQYHSHDLAKEPVQSTWFEGTDTVFHVAAKAGVGGSYESYRQANLTATENLLRASTEIGVTKFIYTSTPSVAFSAEPIQGGNESLPYSKENFSPYASTKALAEQAVLSYHNTQGMRTIALRPHLIWGEGDPHLLPRVISRHRSGKLKIVGNGKNLVDLTHLDNVIHAHLCAFQSMSADSLLGGKAYFIGQNEPVALWQWLNEIFDQLNLPPLKKSVSFETAFLLGQVIEKIWSLFRLSSDPPMTRFVATQLAHDHWFSSLAAERDLGYQPLISMEEAMQKTLPWLKTL